MEKLSTVQGSRRKIFKQGKLTIGLDLGDRSSYYCVLDEAGKVIQEGSVGTSVVQSKSEISGVLMCLAGGGACDEEPFNG